MLKSGVKILLLFRSLLVMEKEALQSIGTTYYLIGHLNAYTVKHLFGVTFTGSVLVHP